MLRVSQHVIEPGPRRSQESTDACAAVMSRPEKSSTRRSRPGSPCVHLSDSSWTRCRNAPGVPRPCGLAPSARAFHRATCLATLASHTTCPHRIRTQIVRRDSSISPTSQVGTVHLAHKTSVDECLQPRESIPIIMIKVRQFGNIRHFS